MSTVFYGFRAKNDNNLYEQIGVMKYLVSTSPFPEVYKIDGVEIQIFRTFAGIVYRVLENGYGLKNVMWKEPETFPQCSYDNRTDIPEEDLNNKKIAIAVDELIHQGAYSIEIIVEQFLTGEEP